MDATEFLGSAGLRLLLMGWPNGISLPYSCILTLFFVAKQPLTRSCINFLYTFQVQFVVVLCAQTSM